MQGDTGPSSCSYKAMPRPIRYIIVSQESTDPDPLGQGQYSAYPSHKHATVAEPASTKRKMSK